MGRGQPEMTSPRLLFIQRTKFIRRAEQVLRRADQPRFQMSVIVLATGAFGFLASYLFLHFGLTSMAVRYPLAIGVAYLTFLGLLRLWLAYQGRRLDDGADFSNVIDPIPIGSTGTSMSPSAEPFTRNRLNIGLPPRSDKRGFRLRVWRRSLRSADF